MKQMMKQNIKNPVIALVFLLIVLIYGVKAEETVNHPAWSYKTAGDVWSVSINKDNYVVAGSGSKIYFFNKEGELLWSYKTGGWVKSVSINKDNYVVAGSTDHKVYFFNKDGKLLWSFDAGSWNWIKSVSISKDNYVVAGSRNFKVYFFNKEGKLLWSYKTGSNWVLSVSTTYNGYVAVGSRDSKIYFFNKEGELLWSYKTGGWVRSVSINMDNYVVAGSDKVYFFEPLTSKQTNLANQIQPNSMNSSPKTTPTSMAGFELILSIIGMLIAYSLRRT